MKNYNFIYLKAVVVCVLSILSFGLEAASLYEIKIEANQLNVREYPTLKSDVIGRLNKGSTTIASRSGSKNWYFVQLEDSSGYISSNHVKLIRVILTDNTISNN